jgi:2',3'-cyclic-nucleotide 2'-phosphodiesterase (5'-nucleotidase family)
LKLSIGLFVLLALLQVVTIASSLTILYTNDIHSRFDRLEGLAMLIAEERSQTDDLLLFDVGDAWHDFRVPLYAVWGADEIVAWMNRIGYDAMAVGNHDLYWGAERLAELSSEADFPLLAANLLPWYGVVAPFTPYTIRTVDGLQVLIIGLITPEDFPYPDYPWVRYIEPAEALRMVLEKMRAGVDFVVVLGHLSVARAVQITRVVPDIDVFLTGHSHETTPDPVREGKTLILQAGAFGLYLGRLKLEIDSRSREIVSARNSLLATKRTPVVLNRGYMKLFTVVALIATSLLLLTR